MQVGTQTQPALCFLKIKASQQIPDVLGEPQTIDRVCVCVRRDDPATLIEILLKLRFGEADKDDVLRMVPDSLSVSVFKASRSVHPLQLLVW